LIELPPSNLITDKPLNDTLSSSHTLIEFLPINISFTTIYETIPYEKLIKTSLLNPAIKSTRITNIESQNNKNSTLIKTILSSILITTQDKGEIKCSNEIILKNECIDKAISNEQVEDIKSILRNEIINGEYNNTNNYIIKTKFFLFEVSAIKEQKKKSFHIYLQ
jgi:hypothetical protein